MLPLRARSILALLLTVPAAACSTLTPGSGLAPPEGRLITMEEIERSGADNAWEILERTGAHMFLDETPDGRSLQIVNRGRSSILLDDSPLVVVDGARTMDLSALWNVPARAIQSIRILSGVSATKYFGAGGGGGAIVLRTRTGPDR